MNIKNVGLFFCTTLFFLSCVTTGTKLTSGNSYKQKYKDQLEAGSKLIASGYIFTVEQTSEGNFIQKQFYPDTRQITHFYTYTNRSLNAKNGKATEWWDNGNLNFEGAYKNNLKTGEWKYYNSQKGYLNSFGKYEKGERQGLWTSTNEDQIVTSEYNYQNGKKQGAYKLFNKEGVLVEQGTYENDEISKQEFLTEKKEFKIVEEMPQFKGCESEKDYKKRKKCAEIAMLKFVYRKIKYPSFAREEGIEGMCIAEFVVDKTGEIIDVNIKRGICKEIGREVLRVIKLMPKWNPGLQGGEPVKVHYRLPVNFKLT